MTYKTAKQATQDRIASLNRRLDTLHEEIEDVRLVQGRELTYAALRDKLTDLLWQISRLEEDLKTHDEGRGAVGAGEWRWVGGHR